MTLTAVVVDDEPLARRRLVRLLEAEPEVEVVAVCPNGREAVRAVREHRPGLLFLDVQMPELDGFGVLRELEAEGLPQVVFVTAYDRYAIKAFEVHALDYLLKPYTPDRLKGTLRRALDGAAASGDGTARVIELLESLRGAQREGARAPGAASAYLTR
ncbi:MAG TPA: response regulator, partial [Longimicrobium sp.]|nr:response regulator [Longimicrobium sp.]